MSRDAHGRAPDDRLLDAIGTVAAGQGFDVDDVTVRLSSGTRLIRIVVDRDGGVTLDAAAALSRTIGLALDNEYDDVLGEAAYTLEVTSRGVGAPLTRPRHFRRAAGRLATLTLRDGSSRSVRIVAAGPDTVTVFDGRDGVDPSTVALADVASAKVEVEFAAPPPAVVAALAARRAASGADEYSDDAAPHGAEVNEGNDAR